MDILAEIAEALHSELKAFNTLFERAFESDVPLLKAACEHVHQRVGKQMRPVVVMLAARMCGNINNNTLAAAAAYETLHTGSLVHDDVVDDTMQRRGQKSLNAVFNNQAAVLVGDFLLTKAMGFVAMTRDLRLLDLLVELSEEIASGELLQMQHAYSMPTEEEYFTIIRHKTASLFAICAKSGALTATDNTEWHEKMHRFGELLGLCFQIKDDIFDYTPTADIGKPVLNDIREGKVTLPLLHALQQVSEAEREHWLDVIKNNELDADTVAQIVALVEQHDGIGYAEQQMERLAAEARETIAPFANEETKRMMNELLEYVKNRKR